MKPSSLKKGSEALALAVGLFLLFYSLTLMTKPGANQGVEALPEKYATTVRGLTISAGSNKLNASMISGVNPVDYASVGKVVVTNTTASLGASASSGHWDHQRKTYPPEKVGEVERAQAAPKKH